VYIPVVSNSTAEHNAFFVSAFGTELSVVLTVQKDPNVGARESRVSSG
jgi:hypothetical protein